MPEDKTTSPKIWIGLFLIIIGGLFLLDNFHIIEIPYFIRDIGILPLFFLVAGAAVFFSTNNKLGGIVLFLIGIFFMGGEFWPIVLMVIGAYFLFSKDRPFRFATKIHMEDDDKEAKDQDKINDMSIFGGGEKTYYTSNFKGGSVISIFGGSEINLNNCKLAEGTNTIDMVTIFGGNTFIVPRDWLIVNEALPLFGGFSDKRVKDPNISYDESKKLVIKGIVIFGGGEIKSY
ncbi:MAG: hypothetical protein PVH88_15685 [Ignavibacteria bacterium]|jgi:predicted membrane protein